MYQICWIHLLRCKRKRNKWCGVRIPNVGKFSWRMVREDYKDMVWHTCDNLHSTEFAFNALLEQNFDPLSP